MLEVDVRVAEGLITAKPQRLAKFVRAVTRTNRTVNERADSVVSINDP